MPSPFSDLIRSPTLQPDFQTNMLSFRATRNARRILSSSGETQEFKGLGHLFAQDLKVIMPHVRLGIAMTPIDHCPP
jgi:hypothetical protein